MAAKIEKMSAVQGADPNGPEYFEAELQHQTCVFVLPVVGEQMG